MKNIKMQLIEKWLLNYYICCHLDIYVISKIECRSIQFILFYSTFYTNMLIFITYIYYF